MLKFWPIPCEKIGLLLLRSPRSNRTLLHGAWMIWMQTTEQYIFEPYPAHMHLSARWCILLSSGSTVQTNVDSRILYISMISLASTWIWDTMMRPHVAVVFELMRHAGSIPSFQSVLCCTFTKDFVHCTADRAQVTEYNDIKAWRTRWDKMDSDIPRLSQTDVCSLAGLQSFSRKVLATVVGWSSKKEAESWMHCHCGNVVVTW